MTETFKIRETCFKYFSAPESSIAAKTNTIENNCQNRFCECVFCHNSNSMCVVMLDFVYRKPKLHAVSAGRVVRVEIAGDDG